VLHKLVRFIVVDNPLFGRRKIVLMKHSINLAKGGTFLFVLWMMQSHNVWSPTAYAYLALHGSYALIWTAKSYIFPDVQWQQPQTAAGFLVTVLVLCGYWLAPYFLISTRFNASVFRIFCCVLTYIIGVVTMTVSDCQKYWTLKYHRGLITNGMFTCSRNINYLAEMMLYGSFAALQPSLIPWCYLLIIWSHVFWPNMMLKDASMSRYGAAWQRYTAQSGMLLPKLSTLFRSFTAVSAEDSAYLQQEQAQQDLRRVGRHQKD